MIRDYNITQGTTFNTAIRIANTITSINSNITGYSIRSQMRRSWQTQNATANLVVTINDGSNGLFFLGLSAANTANITHGRYFYDVEATTPSDTVVLLQEGIIHINPGYTK